MHGYINYNSEKYIATVNGEKISLNTFKKMYFLEQEKQKKILGKNFFKIYNNKNFIKKTYDHVIIQLVNNILLEQYAKKIKLQTNDSEIKQIILNSPLFQKNKIFNKEQYFNYLASINLTNDEYINIIKTKINTENLINTIIHSSFVLKNEQNNIIKLLSQKRVIKKSTITINPIIHQQKVSKIEAQNYFYKNRNNFYIPEKFKIHFVKLHLNQFKSSCNNKEINDFYFKNIQQYFTKEKKRYSIIQTKSKKEALLILSELSNKPENFSKIAKTKSIDPISSQKGGDIGWMSSEIIPNEIKIANLQKKNQISDVIPFHNEFLIVKLNDISPPRQKNIQEVSNIITKKIQYKKSLNLYNTFINQISSIIKNDPKKVEDILKKNNLLIKETNWFDQNSIPKDLNYDILKKVIFQEKLLQKNHALKPYFNFIVLNKNTSFLIKLINFQNKKKQVFQQVQNNIIKKLKIIKAIQYTKQKVENIIRELNEGKNNLFQKSHLYFSKPEIISRYDHDPITSIIFSLPQPKDGKKKYASYQDQNKNFVIVSLEKTYNTKFSPEEKNMILEYLEKNNIQVIFDSILKDLREKSIITYNRTEYDEYFIKNNSR